MNKQISIVLIITFSIGLGIMLGFPIGYNWDSEESSDKEISDFGYHWACVNYHPLK